MNQVIPGFYSSSAPGLQKISPSVLIIWSVGGLHRSVVAQSSFRADAVGMVGEEGGCGDRTADAR